MVSVCKRSGQYVNFDKSKIVNAILKAMRNGNGIVESSIAYDIAEEIQYENCDKKEVSIFEIEDAVFEKLVQKDQLLTAKAYEGYRKLREFQRERTNTTDREIRELLLGDSDYWNSENSNKNPKLVTTQRDYMAGIVSADVSRRILLPPEIVQAHENSILHFHDIDYFAQQSHNCCLVNLEDMLQNGTVISETLIEKPHSFSTACNIATQIIAQVASSQYGGQSISLAHLAPFVDISRQKLREKVKREVELVAATSTSVEDVNYAETIETIVKERLRDEIRRGVQTIQYQVVTLMTTNGQAPFLTVFLYLNEAKNAQEKEDLALLIEETLVQRYEGVKNEQGILITPSFPKLIYVLDDSNTTEDSKYWYLTELAAKCTAKRMVPDYISEKVMMELKVDKTGNGNTYACMGCVEGEEIVTYKYKEKLYVESFKRMWSRLADYFAVKCQNGDCEDYLYLDTVDLKVYDTEKGFVGTKRVIRNKNNAWINVKLSNGRSLVCTPDHPFHTDRGRVEACELQESDKVMINPWQYYEENVVFDDDKAWALGFMLCDGFYDKHVVASIAYDSENDIEAKYISCMKKCFNTDVKVVERHRGVKGNYKDLCCHGNITNMSDYFYSKFEGITKARRHIPNEVFEWNYTAKLSFMAGMIDADGYISSPSNKKTVVNIGSVNKELALQQAALARALGMSAAVYQNHYTKKNPKAIRYKVEFTPSDDLMIYIISEKKKNNFKSNENNNVHYWSLVNKIEHIESKGEFSYDVTTESDHFEVSGIYSYNCRSFLTPYINKEGIPQYYGRFNQGVVTINLVDIALSSGRDLNVFWSLFENRTELCHKALRIRHEHLLGTQSDVAPILWRHGALARLKKSEVIDELLYNGYSTISLGYAGLYECVKYMTGLTHSDEGEGEAFGLEVMQALNDKCNRWKKDENIDYSLYGTPLESTTYKFAKNLQERFGVIEGITDRNYVTNSYHIPVFEEIDPFEKLRIEAKFQKLSPGGAISYIETADMQNNIQAVLEMLKFIYDNIMYAELNTKSDYCNACGYDGEITLINEDGKLIWECPECGNRDSAQMNVARRTCGYLGTASNGWNQGRLGDIHDRYVHLDNHEIDL